jgi:peptidoglycan-associated lipoprotein
MKSAFQPLCLAVATLALVLSGCSKKPVRPDPSATVLGQQGSSGLNPENVQSNADLNGLQSRDAGFDQNGQLRGAVDSVYFAFDKYDIRPSERAKAKAAKDYLDKNPQYRMILEGHCDWRGTAEYNLALGDRRANAVKKYLITLGVGADKLETVSKGSEEATKDADEATRAKDRRVDFVVSKGGAIGPAAAAGPAAPAAPAAP